MSPAVRFSPILLLLMVLLWARAPLAASGMNESSRQDTVFTSQQDSALLIGHLQQVFQEFEAKNDGQTEKAFFQQVDHALRTAQKKNLVLVVGKELNRFGEQLRNEARYAAAIRLHKKAIEIGEKLHDIKLIIIANNDLGVVFRRIDSYQKAMEYHLRALRLASEINDSVSRAIAINSIGNVYLMLGNYDQALRYFKQSLRLEQNRNNPIGIAINLNNIGHVYEENGFLDKALRYYELSLEINRKIPSKRGIAICSNDIANLLKKQRRYKEALRFSLNALRIAKEINDYDNLAYAYIKTGALYSALKNYQKAFEYLQPGIELARKIRARSTLEDGYNTLFNTYMSLKDYKTAIDYLKLKQAYHDSLINLDVKKNIARMQIQFDTERQKSQIQLQQQKTKIAMLQVKKQKYLLYFAWTSFAIVLFFLAFMIFYLISKSKQTRLLLEKTREIEAAEKKLKQSNEALQQALENVENSARAKTEFLANISHEIRTPLNSVIGFSDLLCSMTSDERQKNYLQTIKSSGESLLGLINDILDLSKIEEGKIELEFKETDIRRVIEDVVNIFSLEASNKGLHLLVEVEENVPPFLIFEEARLRQILLNLVGNAIKFTNEGHVTLHAHTLSEQTDGTAVTLVIEVIDTGTGISPEDQKMIFIPFRQASSHQKAAGVGLGLSITQRLIKVMDGEIKLDSTVGKGSRFTLVFHHVQVGHADEKKKGLYLPEKNKNEKKCLFINEAHPLKQEIVQIFTTYGFQVDDVGLNLSRARKKIENYRLVVFCCMGKEILKNTWNLFEKENLDNRYVFLVLNTEKDFSFDDKKVVSIPLYKGMEKEAKQRLRDFIRQFEEDEMARHLLFCGNSQKEKEIFDRLIQIYQQDFVPALHTKMLDTIGQFVRHIQQLSSEYGMIQLQNFAKEMEAHIKDFDVVFIEKQMHIFQKAYRIMIKDR